jgi:CBS domain-containing protein
MKIQTILTTKGSHVVTIQAGQTLQGALDLLVQHNIGAVVVLEGPDRVVGILSERDLIRALAHGGDMTAQTVAAVMTKNVVVGSPQDDLSSVMHTMTQKRFRHLPVVDQGKLVGIVSIGDMVKAQLDEYQGELDTLETQIVSD